MKLSLAFSKHSRPTNALVRRMASAQQYFPYEQSEVIELVNGSCGFSRHTDSLSLVPLVQRGAQGSFLLLSGVPISTRGPLTDRLRAVLTTGFSAAVDELCSLDGAFIAVLWDAPSKRLAVVTDFLGLKPLYISETDSHLLMASTIKGIVCGGAVPLQPDPGGWGAFFSLGHFIGNRTSVQEIRCAEPGTAYVYHAETGSLAAARYWKYPQEKNIKDLTQADTGSVVEALRAEAKAYLNHTRTGTVSLSGGVDSRLILGVVLDVGIQPKILILKHPDENQDCDGRFAQRVVRRLGLSYDVHCPVRSFYNSEQYVDYLVLNEVMTPSLYLYIAQLATYLTPSMISAWEGLVPGAVLRPPGGDHGNTFDEYLKRKSTPKHSRTWRAARYLFRPAFAQEMYASFMGDFRQETSRYGNTAFGASEFVVRNRMRNRTGPNPVKVYSNYVLPFIPGMSRAFFEAGATIPYSLRLDHKFYLEIFRRHFPEAARVPFCSGRQVLPSTKIIDLDYQLTRLKNAPALQRYTSALARRIGHPRSQWWDHAPLVGRVIRQVSSQEPAWNGEPVWNADALRATQKGEAPENLQEECERILFYWQIWKWVIGGELTTRPSKLRGSLALSRVEEAAGECDSDGLRRRVQWPQQRIAAFPKE